MRTIKFRAWDGINMNPVQGLVFDFTTPTVIGNIGENYKEDFDAEAVMQFTGLLDKNGLQEVYEGDIIDSNGNIKGNIYEMDKGETDFVIEGLGTSAWSETEKRGLERGLKYAQ